MTRNTENSKAEQKVRCDNGYQALIEGEITDIHLTGIATKILQHMDRVRNVSDLAQARRWVMELLQNARDVAYPEQPVRVQITLKDRQLIFSHNGRPFRVKDILSIINQVSSKASDESSVGKFGTGFVTTFQLSERVEIKSVLQDKCLPFKRFHITLDRSGLDRDSILSAINKSMQELEKVDREKEMDRFDSNAFNTSFIYHLETEESKEAARIGLRDLQHSVFYVLLFSKNINEIALVYEESDRKEKIVYRRKQNGTTKILNDVLERTDFEVILGRKKEIHSLVHLSEENITIAAGWKSSEGFQPLSEHTARLFIDFPLIGAEEFPFPMVVGSREFHPNEPRSGITLVDNAGSLDALANKAVIEKAVKLYGEFLHAAVIGEEKGLEHIMYIPEYKENREISENWVRCHIYKAIYRQISQEFFLPSKESFYSINTKGMYLLKEEAADIRKKLVELLQEIPSVAVPEDDTDWYSALKNYSISDEKCYSLNSFLYNLPELLREYNSFLKAELPEEEALQKTLLWLHRGYELGMSVEETCMDIRTGKIKIFPNQKNWKELYLYPVNEVKRDPGIPEILKDVTEHLDQLVPSGIIRNDLNIRKQLLHKDFVSGSLPELTDFETARLESYIIEKSNRGYKVSYYNIYQGIYDSAWEKAWMLLLSCGPNKDIYELGRTIFKEKLPEYKACGNEWKASVWGNAYYAVMNLMADEIQNTIELKSFADKYFDGENPTITWLNRFYERAEQLMTHDIDYKKIFPDQYGRFTAGAEMRQDETKNDVLKEIVLTFKQEFFGCDYFEKTLDRRIRIEKMRFPQVTESMVAQQLNQVLQQLLRQQNIAETPIEYQMACTKLLGWMDENPEKAAQYFPSFSMETDKVKLMSPGAIVTLQKRTKDLDRLLKDAGVSSIEELIESAKQQAVKEAEKNAISNTAGWDSDCDVYFGEEFSEYEEKERLELLRRIGSSGELYALEQVKKYFVENGATLFSEEEQLVTYLMEDGRTAEVLYGDTALYHQAGWDIAVTVKGSEEEAERYYLEVKTHTTGSCKRGQLALSNEQMKLAVSEREHYGVLSVSYNYKEWRGVKCNVYMDPLQQFVRGGIAGGQDTYIFYEKRA